MPTIKFNNVYKYYLNNKNKEAIAALYNLNITIPNNSFVVLTGSSGGGKTTFLKVLSGILKINSGEILFDNLKVNNLMPKDREVSFLSQQFALYPTMTVFENIAYPLKIEKVNASEIKRRVYDIAKEFDIDFLLSRKPKLISIGQQQRVALARALIKKPRVLLLDEPLSNLDPKNKINLINLLNEIYETTNINIILATHDLNYFKSTNYIHLSIENGEITNL